MKKHWNDLVVSAAPLINFLECDSFFDKGFDGDVTNKLILTDAKIAFQYASDDSSEDFDDWESVSESVDLFPADFEWSSWVTHNLLKNNFFSISKKDFNGVIEKWTQGEVCLLLELMQRDIKILLNCYSNEFFPPIWKDILAVYLNNGFPCGWQGRYPQGKLVVFSNQ